MSVCSFLGCLKVDLKLRCRKAAMKPLITNKMKKRMQLVRKYINWTKEQWGNIIFSGKSNFKDPTGGGQDHHVTNRLILLQFMIHS